MSEPTHQFLAQPRGKLLREPDINKCWEVVNMLYCGQPRAAEVHQCVFPEPAMSENKVPELKPCPFCQRSVKAVPIKGLAGVTELVGCDNEQCPASDISCRPERWNTRVDLSPATPEPWDAVRDLLSLMQQDSHGMWAFNSFSRDASKFQAIIERLHAATPASHVDEERIAEIRKVNRDSRVDTMYLLTAYDELRAQRDRLIQTLEIRAQRETEMLEEVAARLAPKEPAPADRVEGEQKTTNPERGTHVCVDGDVNLGQSSACVLCSPVSQE